MPRSWAACTAAMIVQMWRTRHLLVRAGVTALVLLQVAWGSDVPFLPAQNLIGDSQILRFKPARRIKQEHNDFRKIYRTLGICGGQAFELVVHLGFLADRKSVV